LKTAYIVNSMVLRGSASGWQAINDHIKHCSGSSGEIRITKAGGQAVSLTKEAVKSGCGMVIAVGGDGTVNEVLNGLFENDAHINPNVVLGIIPIGSGCDFARCLGIPKNISGALELIDRGITKKIDVGRATYVDLDGNVTSRLFINMADIGAGGVVVQKARQAPRLLGRRPNYLWGILHVAINYKPKKVTITIDDDFTVSLLVLNMMIANGRYFGFGFQPAPQAVTDDGLFDIVNLGNLSMLENLLHLPKLYMGTHLNVNKVRSYCGKRVVAESEEEVLLEVDGDLIGKRPTTLELLFLDKTAAQLPASCAYIGSLAHPQRT